MPYKPTPQPPPFLTTIIHWVEKRPGLTAFNVGYELGRWRYSQLAEHLMDWLPEFALNWQERQSINAANAVPILRKAVLKLYQSKKYKKRGEFGELLLHIVMRQTFNTVPAICKIFYKDSVNNTVKGFDAVHVRPTKKGLELWLGEAKFYEDISAAIREVVKEIDKHSKSKYLKNEFLVIIDKIEEECPYSDKLRKLLGRHTSLDEVFDSACIPVLLTYNSNTLKKHTKQSAQLEFEMKAEIQNHYQSFCKNTLPKNLQIHLFLIPLNTKQQLIGELDRRLKRWQSI